MELIDEQYTRTPFYGSRRLTVWLNNLGLSVNRKRTVRLMRQMGLQAIYPKPKLSRRNAEHKIYPYLLRDLIVDKPDQAWATDITYIRLKSGFVYLVAIMDWYSRYVNSWNLSISLEVDFCVEALEKALDISTPDIFNSDQGSQFTSNKFTTILREQDIQISMDGKGRVFDNIFVERLWRSLKWEEVYLNDYESVIECKQALDKYFYFYNFDRPHQALGYKTPYDMYVDKQSKKRKLNQKLIQAKGAP